MVNLIARTACAGLLPIAHGGITIAEVVAEHLTSVAPYNGRTKAVSAALKDQTGGGLPPVMRRAGNVTWFGHGTYLVAGRIDLDGLAAVTDQSDAWAVVEIAGAGVEDVLARLVPIDVRSAVFKKNHCAKTMLGHMSVLIVRTGPHSFEISVMRSMAATMVHELDLALRGVVLRYESFDASGGDI